MSSGHHRITWRRNIAENFNWLSRVQERYRQTDDRRQTTDRRTDDDEFGLDQYHTNQTKKMKREKKTKPKMMRN